MSVIAEIVAKLQKALDTQEVELSDFSEAHEGHATLQSAATNLHLSGRIRSPKFKGLSRLQRERLLHSILTKELADGTIHALSMQLEES